MHAPQWKENEELAFPFMVELPEIELGPLGLVAHAFTPQTILLVPLLCCLQLVLNSLPFVMPGLKAELIVRITFGFRAKMLQSI